MKKTLVILTIFALILPFTYSYAIGEEVNEKSFFEISKLEVTKNENIEMTIQ